MCSEPSKAIGIEKVCVNCRTKVFLTMINWSRCDAANHAEKSAGLWAGSRLQEDLDLHKDQHRGKVYVGMR